MRHVVGFLTGLALAPVLILGAGWAVPRLAELKGQGATFLSAGGAVTVAVASALALLVAVAMAAPRLTPMVPGIAGLTLIGLSTAVVLRPGLADRLPAGPGLSGALDLLPLGVFLPMGLALLVPMFVGARWTGADQRDGITEDEYFDGLYDEDYEDYEDEPAPGHARRPAPQPTGTPSAPGTRAAE